MSRTSYVDALQVVSRKRDHGSLASIRIATSDERINRWLRRSQSDLSMMIASLPTGFYPYAGVPWFSTVFGRDGIITALQLLWVAPQVARGVLSYLAATQATAFDAERDAEPGKILHEMRKGEMAELKEVPFGRYYGTIDATPLFIVLAAAYFERTCDFDFLSAIWPNLLAALDWIDNYGDCDGDGFVEYERRSDSGLTQQGWKDSSDSVFTATASLAVGPIALCEVQSYVYAARQGMAALAREMGDHALSDRLLTQAAQLRERFQAQFWSEELSNVRAGAGRGKEAVPGPRLQRRTLPLRALHRTRNFIPSARRCFRTSSIQDGAFARLPPQRRVSIRCRTTMDRCGLTTTDDRLGRAAAPGKEGGDESVVRPARSFL